MIRQVSQCNTSTRLVVLLSEHSANIAMSDDNKRKTKCGHSIPV